MQNRRRRSAVGCAVIACLVGVTAVDAGSSEPQLVIRHARVFDGFRVIPNADVVVVDGRITRVGGGFAIPADAEIIDGTGCTLLPGLIDSHTHVIAPNMLEQAILFGVTTELDMFSSWQMGARVREDQTQGRRPASADLRSAGTLVTAPGGHGTQFGVPIPTITGPEQAEDFVRARVNEGSDYIKIVCEDGEGLGMTLPTISNETMAAVVKAAHTHDKLAVVHISSLTRARDAISAGADGLVHTHMAEEEDPTFGRYAAEHDVFVVPTLSVLESVCGIAGGAALTQDETLRPYLSPAIVAGLKRSFPPGPATEQTFTAIKAGVRQLADAGVDILAGTDAPNPGTVNGVSMHRELELLVDCGLTPIQALRAATSVPARRFGLADRGSIRPGLRADLLLVEGDPTSEITDTRRIVAVWKAGVRLERREVAEPALAVAGGAPDGGPGDGLVSDFENGDLSVEFGAGWSVSSDRLAGGVSDATLAAIEGGAEHSGHCMSIVADVRAGAAQIWAGAIFSPGAAPMTPKDMSSRKSISFWTKGDGGTYYVMLFLQSRGFTPVVQSFATEANWTQHVFALSDFNGTDARDLMGVYFGPAGSPGKFMLQIDDVRFE